MGLTIRDPSRPQVIAMDESPVAAFRKKKSASIRVAMEMVRAHEADAVISAGHTGATLMAATLILKTLPGLDRPAIATLLPTMRGHAILIDAGGKCRLQTHPPLPVWHHGQRLCYTCAPTRTSAGWHAEHR